MNIYKQIKRIPAYGNLLKSIQAGESVPGIGLPRGARLAVLSALYSDLKRPLLLISHRADRGLDLFDELTFWSPEAEKYHYPEPNPLFYENATWSSETRRDRLRALTSLTKYHVPGLEVPLPPIIVLSARALMTRTMSRSEYLNNTRILRPGIEMNPDTLLRESHRIGYDTAEIVIEPGKMSRRGGIIDIWPPSEPFPARLEFFGDRIETIRFFNPASQRTVNQSTAIVITPAREYLLPSADMLGKQFTFSEFHIPILHPYTSTIIDFLPKESQIVFDDISLVESAVLEIEEQAVKQRCDAVSAGLLDDTYPVPYYSWSELLDALDKHHWLNMGYPLEDNVAGTPLNQSLLAFQFGQIERFGGRLKSFLDYLENLTAKGVAVGVVSRQAARLRELWTERCGDWQKTEVEFDDFSLTSGWALGGFELITDSEIFGWEHPRRRVRVPITHSTPELPYADFKPGDWIVHVDHGIGRYVGLVKRVLDGREREFLCIEYQNSDQLFIPVHQADRLSRYIGPFGGPPSLDHLGTSNWAETKTRVTEAVKVVAQEMLELYARRKVSVGFAFSPDSPWQIELESSFPYVETPDQKTALLEIKKDMESNRPMDRLLCGDVGYGKTEVALRSAFKAVMDGKQVAVLVPTTVLAQQHFETFRRRLAAFPIEVEMLSRFRSQHEQSEILSALSNGTLDIIIGTHRLISKDVHFKDLGLVIIDEEQRFGVSHKEHFKHLRTEIDVLTLTATPIPRTLYMALTGVRDISNLNTPPEDRLPIVTHIGPYSPRLVRLAILRELERGGQVYFVHNRVQTIPAMKMHLEKLVPEARIAIGHGQMPEHELADVMHGFSSGDIDVLLSTSIIESGLDIPNANTLIVDRGDTFGLSQLYQLRGRVGRGSMRAYAYFFKHRKLSPTPEGQERLEVIAENSHLGAGYSIAMRDLEMRGAGELLGKRQSGHIAAVGFHLYTRLLGATIQAMQKEWNLDYALEKETLRTEYINLPVNVDLPLSAGIPDSYVSDQSLRLQLYRRIADCYDESGLEALMEEFKDRFGDLPEQVRDLFLQVRIKIRAQNAGLISIGAEAGKIVLRYSPDREQKNRKQLPDLSSSVRGGRNAYWCGFLNDIHWQEQLLDVLEFLSQRNNGIK